MKYKVFFSWIFSVLCVTTVTAQTYLTQVKPAGSSQWGYANSKGELVISAKYESCYRFSSEGFAPIYDREKMQYYFINTKGQILITEISDFKLMDALGFDVTGFSDGWVPVRIGRKWGYMNTMGKVGIEAKYDQVTAFNEGYAGADREGKCVVLDIKGNEIPVADGVAELKEFSENMAPFRSTNKKFGFIGTDGQVVIPAQYESVGYFKGGVAWAKDDKKKVGYINTKGEWLVKPKFLAGKEFDAESGLARVRDGVLWMYVSRTGEILKVEDTQLYGDFCNGLAIGKKNDKAGFYDNKGNWVIPPQYEAVREFKNGFAAAKLKGKWGFIDTKGNWAMQPQFDGVKDLELIK